MLAAVLKMVSPLIDVCTRVHTYEAALPGLMPSLPAVATPVCQIGMQMPFAMYSQTNFSASANSMGTMKAMKEDSKEKTKPIEITELSAKKVDSMHITPQWKSGRRPARAEILLRHAISYRTVTSISSAATVIRSMMQTSLRPFSVDCFLQQCVYASWGTSPADSRFDNLDRARLFEHLPVGVRTSPRNEARSKPKSCQVEKTASIPPSWPGKRAGNN